MRQAALENRFVLFSGSRLWAIACTLFAAAIAATDLRAQISFEDVSVDSDVAFSERDYGSSWGDVNGDGWPDLLVTGHAATTRIYINDGDGTFTERSDTLWPGSSIRDAHGAAWGDFDNDGDQDAFILTGAANGTASTPNYFLVNYSGTLVDEADSRGLTYPLARGRTPLWVDWNQDGLLDVFEAAEIRTGNTSELFEQIGGVFSGVGLSSLTAGQTNYFAQVKDLLGDGVLKLIIHHDNDYPGRIIEVGADPLQDLKLAHGIPSTPRVIDAIIEDLDGDLDHDILLLRTRRDAPEVIKTGPNSIEAFLRLNSSFGDRGFEFASNGGLNVQADPSWYIMPSQIFIGSSGRHPSSLNFSVTTSDIGIMSHTTSGPPAVYIGYDPTPPGSWQLVAHSSNSRGLEFKINASEPVGNPQAIGFTNGSFYMPERLYIQTESGFVDSTNAAGFGLPSGCESAVAADFDNDTDLDIYMACRSQVDNPPNMLWENLGDGTFQRVPGAGGAAGSVDGRGNNVTVADYDHDGFMDLFVTNGWGAPMLASDGPFQLFRNTGNDNHWVQFDLRGTVSNRDAIGAKVLLLAGGKTQLREQDGGIHAQTQNDRLMHFGLGDSTVIDQLTIHWPSGIIQVVDNLAADRMHTIIEDDSPGGSVEVPVTQWLNQQGGVSTPGNRLVFDGTGDFFGWSSQANSIPMSGLGFTENYEVRFQVLSNPANTNWVVGLGINDSGPSRTDIDYGFRSLNGNLQIRQNGNWLRSVGPLSIGDILSLWVGDGMIEWRLNGASLYSSTYAGTPDFYVDSSFKTGSNPMSLGVTVLGDGDSPPDPPEAGAINSWTNAAGGVTASGNDLIFSGTPASWTNTINSVLLSSLGAGSDFTVSWTIDTNPAGTIWVVGLGVIESGPARTDVDFGLRSSNGMLEIRRNGNWLQSAGPLSVGDKLSIRVSGSSLEYQHNGVTLRTITVSGSENFYIDTAFKIGAVQLGSFTLTQ